MKSISFWQNTGKVFRKILGVRNNQFVSSGMKDDVTMIFFGANGTFPNLKTA